MPGLLIPFLIGAIMFTAVGSMTTGGITAVGVVGPMMATLGLAPISTVLAIGAGTMIFNHVNNSGFWVVSKFFNLDMKQGFKYITLPDAVAGVFGLIVIFGSPLWASSKLTNPGNHRKTQFLGNCQSS